MHRMMQSSGTAEGLRGLIDSSILKSLKKIIEHRALFGPSVVPIGMCYFATYSGCFNHGNSDQHHGNVCAQ
jgi:E3 ubiquitin-protein ligase HUWE1